MKRRVNVYSMAPLAFMPIVQTEALRKQARDALGEMIVESGLPKPKFVITGVERADDVMKGTRAWAEAEW